MVPAPRTVCDANLYAMSLGMPMRTAPSASASITTYTCKYSKHADEHNKLNHHAPYVRRRKTIRLVFEISTSTVRLEKYSPDLDLRSYNILKLCKINTYTKCIIIQYNFNLIRWVKKLLEINSVMIYLNLKNRIGSPNYHRWITVWILRIIQFMYTFKFILLII